MFETLFVFALGCACALGLSVLALKFLFGTFFNGQYNNNHEGERTR